MKWVLKQAEAGDMVRVKLGGIYHYGVFASEDEIIQFGLAPSMRSMLKDSEIEVCTSDVDTFLAGGFLEVAVFDRGEKKKNRPTAEVLDYARSRLGERGYSILYNNCEHFAYECVTGKKYCSQTADVRAFFKALPIVDVYLAAIPEKIEVTAVEPTQKNTELMLISDSRERAESYFAWRLLEYALERTFGYRIKKLRLENGKWVSDKGEYSISVSGGAVAVAVSRKPVEVKLALNADDVETEKASRVESVVLNGREYLFALTTDTPEVLRIYSDINLLKQ